MASTSQEGERSPLLVTLLSSEWRSSTDRDLSTLIRELAIQLAKHPSVQVSVFLPQCSEDDKRIAASHKVKLIEAEEMTGVDPIDWLINIPEDHAMDCIIGHGVHLGRQIPVIKRSHQCKWIQIVHHDHEALAMYKSDADAIPIGGKMKETEIKLCELADQVVAIGPKLADTCRRFLCFSEKHQDVIDLTPSIFTEFKDVKQATEERRTFCVLVIGSGDSEDFHLKGYDLAAEAVAQLKDKSYLLKFVCAPRGKEYEIARKLLEHGIDRSQLSVYGLNENRKTLARLFCEVDLAIMPSRSEGFGLTGLEALSAGLPVLVSSNSGLGQALVDVPNGLNCVVDSEDPKHWAERISAVRERKRNVRLAESELLREKYLEEFSWQEPCGALVEKMGNLVTGNLASRRNAQNMAIPLCLPNNFQWSSATGKYIKTGERHSSLYVVSEALQKLRTVRGSVASQRVHKIAATPLCLPNNYKWDSRSGLCTETGARRNSLYVVQEALQNLRTVKGPVCVVAIAGPCKKGKSYVLSQAFNQPEVFPLGHEMSVGGTIGMWLWIVPEKYRDSKGREFTVVLLDSEGTDPVIGENDDQIFTLTVLLASVLIYNSQGVPTRRDLEGLDFIVKLSHCIEVQSTTTQGTRKEHRDSDYFHETFPYFIWLLRDVTQAIPSDCSNIKEYFLKKLFKVQVSSAVAQERQKVAESILRFFCGFEAFTLPCPTNDPKLMKSINDNKNKMNPLFLRGLEEFKSFLRDVLVPKNNFYSGEVVTGEGLAALVEQYVLAINTPGMMPNVQNAWDSFLEAKCSDTLKDALDAYEVAMTTQLKDKLPCDNDQLRRSHDFALQNSEDHFMADTAGISINTIEKYLKKLKELLRERFNLWQIKNETSTREFCNDFLIQLKQAHLDPVLRQLRGEGGATLSFEEMLKEQQQYLELLSQLKVYDEKLTQELAAKAYQEQEKQRLEEQQEQLRQENRVLKREMEMLSEKQREERQKFREQMESERRVQREQLNYMMEANMEQVRQERERFTQENQELKDKLLAVQKTNEENVKIMKKLSDLGSKQEEEKRRLDEQTERAKQAESKRQESRQRMEARRREEKEKLLREMETKIEAQRNALTQEYGKAAKARMGVMQNMREKFQDVEEQLEEV